MSSGPAWRGVARIVLVTAVVFGVCGQAALITTRLAGVSPTASAGGPVRESGSANVDGALPSAAPPPGPSNRATAGEPGTRASPLPASLAGADWPPAARTTPDPWFTLHVPVLMYHRIVALADAGAALPGLVVDPAIFARQMGQLAGAGWHTITLATLQQDLATGRQPPPRTFVITIDDGHVDGLTNALPILRRFGFVATYFVVMGRIHESPYLNAADLRTLADAGMEIADHTMEHRNVARLHGAALDFQIGAAAAAIEQITGRAPTTFAYPAGEWSLEAVGAVQANDLGMAGTTREGVLETWATRFLVPRLRISRSVTPTMLLRLLSGYAID